jgi:hypothetical protein
VGYLGPRGYQPDLDTFQAVAVRPDAGVDAGTPEWIVTNRQYNHRYARWPEQAAFVQALYDGSLGYVEAARFTTRLPWWALLRYTPPFTDPAESRLSNLDKTMADVSVFRRVSWTLSDREIQPHLRVILARALYSSSKFGTVRSWSTRRRLRAWTD